MPVAASHDHDGVRHHATLLGAIGRDVEPLVDVLERHEIVHADLEGGRINRDFGHIDGPRIRSVGIPLVPLVVQQEVAVRVDVGLVVPPDVREPVRI